MTPSVATDGHAEPPAQAVGVMIARRFNGWVEKTQNIIGKTRCGSRGFNGWVTENMFMKVWAMACNTLSDHTERL